MGVSPLIAEANGNLANATIDYLKVDNAANCTVPVISSGLARSTCTYTGGNPAFHSHIYPISVSPMWIRCNFAALIPKRVSLQ